MKRLITFFVLSAVMLTLFAGCESPSDPNVLYEDPLSNKLKKEISTAFSEKYGFEFDWDCVKPDIGTINGCTVVVIRSESMAEIELHKVVISDFEFRNSGPLFLYAYRNGEVCYLREAYEKGWLTKEHIGLLHAKYEEIQQNWSVYYLEWIEAQKEAHNNSSDANLLYKKALTEEEKENIRALILKKFDEIVRWGYVDPYYGTINNYSVVIVHPRKTSDGEAWFQEIAGYTFEWDSPIGLYVYYHDKYSIGVVYTLQEAYEEGWLTESQIGMIHERHEQYRESFPKLLEQWQKTQGN